MLYFLIQVLAYLSLQPMKCTDTRGHPIYIITKKKHMVNIMANFTSKGIEKSVFFFVKGKRTCGIYQAVTTTRKMLGTELIIIIFIILTEIEIWQEKTRGNK